MKKGIAVAGSILVDKINEISLYPQKGELTKILRVEKAVGGCVPNVAIDLKRICPDFVVKAVGKIGNDEFGSFVKETLNNNGVDTENITYSSEKTSFTEVMSERGGQRTFFTYAGASSEFGESDINFDNLNVEMLHLGYFLLLDKIDDGDGLKILKRAKEKGVKTSIDLVSENSTRYSLVIPCLPYVDNLIINEVEAGALTGLAPKRENLQQMAIKLKEFGVSERVIIHTPDLGVCLSNNGYTEVSSFELPGGFIKGTTGAGDAFCAGSLIGIYKNKSDKEILEFASSSAVMALSKADAISGLRSEQEIKDFCKNFTRKQI